MNDSKTETKDPICRMTVDEAPLADFDGGKSNRGV